VLQIAQNVAGDGHGVHFCSVEMSRPQLVTRAISQQCLIDNKRLARRNIQGTEWDDVFAACEKFGKLPLTVDDRPAPTVAEIRNSIRRGITKQRRDHGTDIKLGLVVVDYLQLCKAHGLPREQEISAISAGMLEISKEFDCAVISLSQLNRDIEKRPDRTPKLSDLRESGAIEQDAFGVIFVYREDCYESDETKRNGMADIIVAKLRQGGETGKVTMRYNAPATWFYTEQAELERDIDNMHDDFRCDSDPPPDRHYIDRKQQAAGGYK
jgi:replicative DNA helicase